MAPSSRIRIIGSTSAVATSACPRGVALQGLLADDPGLHPTPLRAPDREFGFPLGGLL